MPPRKTSTKTKYLDRLRDDFLFFLRELWRLVGHADPSWVQYDIADWVSNGPRFRGVRGFRGLGKTYITNAYVLWRLLRNPQERILIASKSNRMAERSLFLIRGWIDRIPWLNHLAPIPNSWQRDSATQFDVGPCQRQAVPSVWTCGMTGQMTGGRASLIVADDVEEKENSMTRSQREALRHRCEEFTHILFPGGDIVFLGTPHHEESLYDFLVEERGFTFRSWPARYPQDGEPTPYISPRLAQAHAAGRIRPGEPTWPERFSDVELQEKELTSGRSGWLMQYQLITKLEEADRHPLKLRDFIVTSVDPVQAPTMLAWGQRNAYGPTIVEEIPGVGLGDDTCFYGPAMVAEQWAPYVGCKAFLDPAGAGEDEMAWAIVGQLHGFLYVKRLGAIGGKGPKATIENLTRIVKELRQYHCWELVIESNFGGDMLAQLIQPIIRRHVLEPGRDDAYPDGWECSVETVHNSGQKELRIIEALEPVMNQHRLVLDTSVAADREAMWQVTRITRDRNSLPHDDRVEALAAAVNLFREMLNQDAEEQAKAFDLELYYQDLEKCGIKVNSPAPRWAEV